LQTQRNIHLHNEICSKLREKAILQLQSLWFSIQTSVLLGIAIAATMVLGVVPAVYASTDEEDTNSNNDFGEDSSQDLATDKADDGSSEMGYHSSSQPVPRFGIGNVQDQGAPDDEEDTSFL
jgi:hypothetical protein